MASVKIEKSEIARLHKDWPEFKILTKIKNESKNEQNKLRTLQISKSSSGII